MNRVEADRAARTEALFRRWPELRGFSLRADGSFSDGDVTCYPALAREHTNELFEDISGALLDLVEESPEAAELLRGRTFARLLH